MLRINEKERQQLQKEVSQLISSEDIAIVKEMIESKDEKDREDKIAAIDAFVLRASTVLQLFSGIEDVEVASALLHSLSIVDTNSLEAFKIEVKNMGEPEMIFDDGTRRKLSDNDKDNIIMLAELICNVRAIRTIKGVNFSSDILIKLIQRNLKIGLEKLVHFVPFLKLFTAVRNDDLEEARVELEDNDVKPNLNSKHQNMDTPLSWAIRHKNNEMALLLLKHHAEVDHNVLNEAAENEMDVHVIKRILSKVPLTSEMMKASMRTAVRNGNVNFVKALIDKDINLIKTPKAYVYQNKETEPLIYSALREISRSDLDMEKRKRIVEVINALLETGADPRMPTDNFMYTYLSKLKSIDTKLYNFMNGTNGIFVFKKGKEHLDYLLKRGNPIEEFPYKLKDAYPDLIKALVSHVIDRRRADVLDTILEIYTPDQLKFLKESAISKKVIAMLNDDTTLQPSIKLKMIEKIESIGSLKSRDLNNVKEHIVLDHKFFKYATSTNNPIVKEAIKNSQDKAYEDNGMSMSSFFSINNKVETQAKIVDAVYTNNFKALKSFKDRNPSLFVNIKLESGLSLLDYAYQQKLAFSIQNEDQTMLEKKSLQVKELLDKKISIEEDAKADDDLKEIKAYRDDYETSEKIVMLLSQSGSQMRTANNQTLLHAAIIAKAPLSDLLFFLLNGTNPKALDAKNKKAIDYVDNTMSLHKELLKNAENGIDFIFKPENAGLLKKVIDEIENEPESLMKKEVLKKLSPVVEQKSKKIFWGEMRHKCFQK